MYFKNRSKTLHTGISSDPLKRVPEKAMASRAKTR